MPGYLTNRYVSFDPALSSDLDAAQLDIDSLDTRVTEAEASIDDLSLNIGV